MRQLYALVQANQRNKKGRGKNAPTFLIINVYQCQYIRGQKRQLMKAMRATDAFQRSSAMPMPRYIERHCVQRKSTRKKSRALSNIQPTTQLKTSNDQRSADAIGHHIKPVRRSTKNDPQRSIADFDTSYFCKILTQLNNHTEQEGCNSQQGPVPIKHNAESGIDKDHCDHITQKASYPAQAGSRRG
jgi:hypothetical protein